MRELQLSFGNQKGNEKIQEVKHMASVRMLIVVMCLIFLACDGDGRKEHLACIPNEELADSDCLAEDIIMLCDPLECESESLGENFELPEIIDSTPLCSAMGCEIVNCQLFIVEDLVIDEEALSGTLFTDIVVDGEPLSGPFLCLIPQ